MGPVCDGHPGRNALRCGRSPFRLDLPGPGLRHLCFETSILYRAVSQFTLYATTRKGSKPDFHNALKSEQASVVYGQFLDKMRQSYVPDRIQDGEFGAMYVERAEMPTTRESAMD